MKDLIIVGASGFGRELLNVVEEINKAEPTWNVLGFIDDSASALDGYDTGYDILGPITGWKPKGEELYALGIADPTTKEKIVPGLKDRGARFATIISPAAGVAERSRVGEGLVAFAGAGVSVDVKIGDFVFLNTLACVGHDSEIGDYCTLGPKVCISGKTMMGKCVNVGALASTYPGVTVGDYAVIGMNSAVLRRVKPNTTVIGVPAKIL